MRIIAGKFKGRVLASPSWSTTRPMSDKVRGALFDILGQEVVEARFLDLYSGTGAVGIEALSRGAREGIFVDKDPRCVDIIKKNISSCDLSQKVEIIGDRVEVAIRQVKGVFDLIFFTPPYAIFDWQLLDFLKFVSHEETTIVAELSSLDDGHWSQLENLKLYDERKYGGTKLLFFIVDFD